MAEEESSREPGAVVEVPPAPSKYEIGRCLGSGGAGPVYLARARNSNDPRPDLNAILAQRVDHHARTEDNRPWLELFDEAETVLRELSD